MKVGLKLAAAGALAMMAVNANAADLGYSFKDAPPAEASFSWAGIYLGVNGGYGWGTVNGGKPVIYDSMSTPEVVFMTTKAYNLDITGAALGGQVGYNWQVGRVVLGAEADLQWANLRGSGSSSTRVPGVGIDLTSEINEFGTVRGRLGYAFDRILIYGTGGFAYGKLETKLALTEAGVVYPRTDKGEHSGWVAGAGIEAAIARNWSVRFEYLHLDLGAEPFSFQYPAIRVAIDKDFSFDLVRVGLNYRF
jgi:outer membrane immunogenic protein